MNKMTMKNLQNKLYRASRDIIGAFLSVARGQAATRRTERDEQAGMGEAEMIGYEVGSADAFEIIENVFKEGFRVGTRPRESLPDSKPKSPIARRGPRGPYKKRQTS